ncbi:tetratricopeptide repeat protein [Psychrobacter immobilis]|uniref:tetratricopeptide repeat protein n=1 Tax=Psychrobacter immobilis TaxID=498 RepID=UPI003FD1DDEE
MNVDDKKIINPSIWKEIEQLQKITRNKHGNKRFAVAQVSIGYKLKQEKELEGASEVLSNVKQLDGFEVYAEAQYLLGDIAESNQRLEKALECWANIKNKDNPEIYILSQYSMGMVFEKQGEFEKALKSWINVEQSKDQKLSSVAKNSIGTILLNQGDIKGALDKWKEIECSIDSHGYATAQYSIGSLLKYRLGDVVNALKAWRKIKRSHSLEFYALAQHSIGIVLENEGETEEALNVWKNVEINDYPEVYTAIQFGIGLLLKGRKGDIKGALVAWNNALLSWHDPKYQKDIELYNAIQFQIGKAYIEKYKHQNLTNKIYYKDYGSYSKIFEYIGFYKYSLYNQDFQSLILAKQTFDSFKSNYSHEVSCYKKICELLISVSERRMGNKYLYLFEVTLNIVNILKVNFENKDTGGYERKLAHYTSVDVTNILLNDDIEKRAGFLRLNTISNMNDPSEGQLLEAFLNNEEDIIYNSPEFDEKFHAFFSCFTFNHDSLNQFRLYGKKDYKEASGISLVFNRKFFQNGDVGGLSFVANSAKLERELVRSSADAISCNSRKTDSYEYMKKQPVMRCVYIDPKSGYIQLAQRNRLTFYREFSKINEISESWSLYQEHIREKTEEFSISLQKLKRLYGDLSFEKEKLKKVGIKLSHSYEILLDEILLPLKYLIKHSAFQEEQECRMIYITSLKDPEVKMDFGKFLYVEYEAEVKKHLDKIYIAPAATQYQPYLAKLLCDTNVKIELSNNPYRQT